MARKSSASKTPPPPPPKEPEVDQETDDQEIDAGADLSVSDNVGDISVEVNVEDLIAQIESDAKTNAMADGTARRKIEDILEEKRIAKEIMDLDDFDIDD